ncbi:hypothetical protein TNCV_3086501 [Trichonephila clavipes]|nr:hypothetical protein TNCV_3086501 [Trichonephila clavipes]
MDDVGVLPLENPPIWTEGQTCKFGLTREEPKQLDHPGDYRRARTPCVLGGYLVASGIEPKPSGLESDALTTRLLTAFPIGIVSIVDRTYYTLMIIQQNTLLSFKNHLRLLDFAALNFKKTKANCKEML